MLLLLLYRFEICPEATADDCNDSTHTMCGKLAYAPFSGSFVCCAAFYCTRYPLAHLSKAYASCGAFPLAQLTARKLRRLRQQQVKAPDPVDLQMQPLRR